MPPQPKRPSAGRGKGRIAAVPPGGDSAFRETLSSRLGKDIKPPTRKRPVQRMDVSVRYTYRAPHDMYGRSGYSVVSNDFLADVLAVLIAQHGMSPIQSAVLLWCIGWQREGGCAPRTRRSPRSWAWSGRTSPGPSAAWSSGT
ncbi:hypothetical protein ACFQ3Z_46400 [Streptomyces nogalater]